VFHDFTHALFAGLKKLDYPETEGVPHRLEDLGFQSESFFLVGKHVRFSILLFRQMVNLLISIVNHFFEPCEIFFNHGRIFHYFGKY